MRKGKDGAAEIVRRHREVAELMVEMDGAWAAERRRYYDGIQKAEDRFRDRSLRLNEAIEKAKRPHERRWREFQARRNQLAGALDRLREEAIQELFPDEST